MFTLKKEMESQIELGVLPDGTMIFVDAPDQNGTLTVHFKDGLVETIQYDG